MLVLDTDHVSILSYPSPSGLELLERLNAARDEVATTVITLEEQLRGWLAEINRLSDPHKQISAYSRLDQRIRFFAAWKILQWDSPAADLFTKLRRDGVRIGTMDLKIACIALVHNAILLTRNSADFDRVPGLRCENWLL